MNNFGRFNSDFDKKFNQQFEAIQKNAGRAVKVGVAAAVVNFILSISVVGVVVYVAMHFISKYW